VHRRAARVVVGWSGLRGIGVGRALIILFEQQHAGEPDQGMVVGVDPDDVRAPADLCVAPAGWWNAADSGRARAADSKLRRRYKREPAAIRADDFVCGAMQVSAGMRGRALVGSVSVARWGSGSERGAVLAITAGPMNWNARCGGDCVAPDGRCDSDRRPSAATVATSIARPV
jgi:hypothetical protein